MPAHFEMPTEFMELADWVSRVGYVRNGYGFLVDPAKHGSSSVEIGASELTTVVRQGARIPAECS